MRDIREYKPNFENELGAPSALYTNKGTVLRINIIYSDNKVFRFDPLYEKSGGIILRPREFFKMYDRGVNLSYDESACYSISDSGNEIFDIKCVPDGISEIAPFVVYPNGFTWTGNIGSRPSETVALIWSPTVLCRFVDDSIASDFFSSPKWWNTPTTLILYADDNEMGCVGSEHACGGHDC